MAYMNKVMLIGNVGRDPETKITTTGTKKVSFSLATSQKYKDAAGEYKEKTQWHNIVCWGKLGDLVEKMVSKGSSLFIEGELSYRKWEDQNGQQKTVTEINGNNFQILGAKQNEQKRTENQSSTQDNYIDDKEDYDLPF
jgi:single-strand DNA-binding protein